MKEREGVRGVGGRISKVDRECYVDIHIHTHTNTHTLTHLYIDNPLIF